MRRIRVAVLGSAGAAAIAFALAAPSGCTTSAIPTPTPEACTLRVTVNPCPQGYTLRVQVDDTNVYYGVPASTQVLSFQVTSGRQHAVEWTYTSGTVVMLDSGTLGVTDTSKNPCLDVVVPCP